MKHIKKNSYFVKMLAILLCVMMAFSTFQMGGFINADAKDAAGILPSIGGSQLLEITEEDYTINNLFTYDGNPHSLEVEAEGFTIEYKELDGEWTTEAPQYVKAGYYTMSIRLSKEGYKTLLLRAEILNILPAKITDVNVSGIEATYGKDNVTQFDLFNITGLQDGDIVEYTVNDGEPQVYNKDAAPKVEKADVYKVVVTVKRGANNPAEDEAIFDYNYKTFTAEVTTTINPGSLEDIVNITAPEQQQYNGQETPLFTVNGVKEGDKITYTQAGNDEVVIDVTADGKLDIAPEVYIPGSYSIDVTVSRENYNDLTATIIYNIAPGTLDTIGLTIEVNENLEYTGEEQTLLSASGYDEEKYEIKYQVVASGTAFDTKGSFTTKATATEAGVYTVYIVAFKDNYDDKLIYSDETAEPPIPYTVTINKAGQSGFGFNNVPNELVVFDDYVKIEATGGQTDGDITYEVIVGAEYVELLPDGSIKAIKSNNDNNASVEVKAIRKGNSNYNDAEATYTVTIVKADLTIKFDEKTPDSIYYNDNNNFEYKIIPQTLNCDCDVAIKYSIINDTFPEDNKPQIDESTGKVTYPILEKDSAEITVKAVIASCDHYVGAEDTYTIELNHIDAPELFITPSDYTDDDGLAWYGRDVVIKENDPDEKWDIIEGNNSAGQDDSKWMDEIIETAEGKYAAKTIAFRNEDGCITKTIEVDAFNIDKTDPVISSSKVIFETKNDSIFAKVINFLTFGSFFNKELEVTVNAEDIFTNSNDKGSGVYLYELIFIDEDGNEVKKVSQDEPVFNINYDEVENFKGTLKVKLTDNTKVNYATYDLVAGETGNSNLLNTTLMLEKDAPVITFSNEGQATFNKNKIYKDGFKFNFSVIDEKEDKYYSGLAGIQVFVVSSKGEEEVYKKEFTTNTEDSKKHNDSIDVEPEVFSVNGKIISAEYFENGAINFKVVAYDKANNKETSDIETLYVDNTAPIISKFEFKYQDDNGDWIDIANEAKNADAVQITDYGYYFNQNVRVYISAKDIASKFETISGLSMIVYQAVDKDGNVVYSDEVTDGVSGDSATISFEINKDFKGQIYAYAVDTLGNSYINGDKFYIISENDKFDAFEYGTAIVEDSESNVYGYAAPNGTVVESIGKHIEEQHITITAPEAVGKQNNSYKFTGMGEIASNDDPSYNDSQLVPLYNSDVTFNVTVEDTYSGIRDVKWTIFEGKPVDGIVPSISDSITIGNDGKFVVKDGEQAGDKGWAIEENTDEKIGTNLVTKISKEIIVSGNHNNMVLLVELTDRAGNTSYDYYVFGIDKDLPEISVSYDKNFEKNDSEYTKFFNTDRIATIQIKERNFDPNGVVIKITNTDKVIPNITNIKWTAGDEDQDGNIIYTATIEYDSDGDYTFAIECTDKAEWKNDGISTGDSIAPFEFTIDKTKPTVNVVYDNNSALNGNYYKADRVATITVTEHNFDAKRFQLLCSAINGTITVDYPSITEWKKDGDVYTTTISYTADAKYTFDFTITDMASNGMEKDFPTEEFYIDKTSPVVSISGIVDQSANNDEGDIGFTVTATDTNFDKFLPVLTGVVYKDGSFETKTIEVGSISNVSNGKEYVVKNIDTDGIYSITCTVVDKAGNAYTQVILQDADGKNYIEKRAGADILAAFSVNRLGSTFTLNDYTQKLIDTYYVKDVTNNVTIIEINPDPIVEQTITLNGKTLEEGKDYNVSLENSETSWYKYSYSINKELFADENEYNIVVTSKDKATNEAFSDVKNLTVKFVVDRTAPVITVTGLKDNGRYQVQTQKVTISPSDDGGMLKTLIVRTVDENGNIIKEIINLSGDELIAALEAGDITFELTETEELYQYVQIISEDFAGNVVGATDEEIYSNVTITTNAFLIFWANQPLRWGSIAGVILLTAAIIFLIVYKKRKKAAK